MNGVHKLFEIINANKEGDKIIAAIGVLSSIIRDQLDNPQSYNKFQADICKMVLQEKMHRKILLFAMNHKENSDLVNIVLEI